MADEEEEWRRGQPAIGDRVRDEDRYGDECMGEDEIDDLGERTDLEDDILSGCYVLNIGIEGIDYPSIWVRAEYIRMYDYLESYYNSFASKLPGRAPGAVLTGQPGIGELLRCVTELRLM